MFRRIGILACRCVAPSTFPAGRKSLEYSEFTSFVTGISIHFHTMISVSPWKSSAGKRTLDRWRSRRQRTPVRQNMQRRSPVSNVYQLGRWAAEQSNNKIADTIGATGELPSQ